MTDEQARNADWNRLLAFLAEADPQNYSELKAPMLILAGNCLPVLADEAAKAYLNQQIDQIVLVGGIGHATKYLYRNFEKQGYDFEPGLSESELCAKYLIEKYQLPEEAMLLETKSTNSGENALFSYELLSKLGSLPERILLMNDPTLQRRTKATFEKEWGKTSVDFYNYVPILPQVTESTKGFSFSDQRLNDLWPADYFQALVLGEMVRLKDDAQGYGPNGKGFIGHVDIPDEVWSAYLRLIAINEKASLKR
ncbi:MULTISPECIES: YdcF family protein [unclassified Enterococcus]|uniref:YdcF family protein n=1 Tax=unclassified Enterococcus TaxID=2608891 RepID=UPI001A9B69C8|nr:YdcF family protein [Enterococcus sp. DIV1271a]MBO1299185.1 YdcF family protein [Enterococcus sp. DIV1271a]